MRVTDSQDLSLSMAWTAAHECNNCLEDGTFQLKNYPSSQMPPELAVRAVSVAFGIEFHFDTV